MLKSRSFVVATLNRKSLPLYSRLFDRKGGIYSSRPDNFITNALVCPNDVHILFMAYSERWRKVRKCFQQLLNVKVVDKFLDLQDAEACQTLHDLVQTPQDYYDHLRRYSSAVILAAAFGQRGATFTSDKVQALYHAQSQFTRIIEPGATPPVDAFPILKYLPEFLAWWKRKAKSIRAEQRALYFALLEETKAKMARGVASNCFLASLIDEQDETQFSDEDIAYIGGILVSAVYDISIFILYSNSRNKTLPGS
jgi:cytochrome P450